MGLVLSRRFDSHSLGSVRSESDSGSLRSRCRRSRTCSHRFFAESSQWRGFGLLPSVSSEERVSKFIFAEKSSPSTWWSFRVFRCSRFGKSHRAKSFFTFCASRHLQSARLGAFLSHVRVAAFLSLAQADSLRKKNRQDFALHFEEAVDFVLLWLNDSEDLDSQRKSQRQTDGQFMLT